MKKLFGIFGKSEAPALRKDPVIVSDGAALKLLLSGEQRKGYGDPMRMTTVFNCVRVLAESVGMLPCNLYIKKGNTRSIADGHKLQRLLSIAPNSYMTAQEFWELLVTCLCLRGNFYVYKVYALGNVVELLPIDPSIVKPILKENNTVEYEVDFKSGKRTLTQDEMWHVRLFTLDGLNGLNPVAYARNALTLSHNMEQLATNLFENGAVTTGVLQTDTSLTDKAFERLTETFTDKHVGASNAYKPMILEEGLEWKPISLNAQDSQFIESRKMSDAQICGMFRVPPHLVANMEKMTLNNIEHMGMSFVNYSLVPYLTRIEHRIQVGLLAENQQTTHYAKFNAGALMRGDLKGRYESYAKGINWGILSPNDCRELEDMNPREGGDVYLTPLNMTSNPEGAVDDD